MYNEVHTVCDRQQKKNNNPINIIPKAKFNKQVFIGSRVSNCIVIWGNPAGEKNVVCNNTDTN